MNSILICEGSTDYSLLQYYMRAAYQWNDDSAHQSGILKISGQKSRRLIKNNNTLTIMATGGCSRLQEGLVSVLKSNELSKPDLSDSYKKVIIVTDHDEVNTESDFGTKVNDILKQYGVVSAQNINNNVWIKCTMNNQVGKKLEFELLLLVIPFGEVGAMETFLLEAIAEKDVYDKSIIDSCKNLVDTVDPEKRYLNSRRIVAKAKFDTYFSIRTAAEQFVERQNILKNVKWEDYNRIQEDFRLLGEL